jgi:hypothetical protein
VGEAVTFLDLTRETVLDLTVNIIPVGILVGMEILFFVLNPWGWDLWYIVAMHFLTVFPLVLLLILTWVSGRVIQNSEGEADELQSRAGRTDGQPERPTRLSLDYWLGD